jgi:hypothetical protein
MCVGTVSTSAISSGVSTLGLVTLLSRTRPAHGPLSMGTRPLAPFLSQHAAYRGGSYEHPRSLFGSYNMCRSRHLFRDFIQQRDPRVNDSRAVPFECPFEEPG